MAIYLLLLTSIERIAGLFPTYFSIFFLATGMLGGLYTLRISRVRKESVFLIILIPFLFLSGLSYGFSLEKLFRAIQLTILILTFIYISHVLTVDSFFKLFSILAPVLIAVFCLELIVKHDLRSAFLNLDIDYFIYSGGTSFYNELKGRGSGVQLVAQGNVYAAALAGCTAIVNFLNRRYGYAACCLFLAICTGSRAILVSAFCIITLISVWRYMPAFRPLLTRGFAAVVILQPIAFLNIQALLSDEVNEFLLSLSPRYVSFIAYSNMGLDNVFGVGLFQGKTFTEYFFARWPIAAHNISLSVFGELGILAYICWSGFLWQVAKVLKNNLAGSVLFVYTVTMFTFIGGFNEFSFWIPLGLAVTLAESNFRVFEERKSQTHPHF